jgi:hypothetical protein
VAIDVLKYCELERRYLVDRHSSNFLGTPPHEREPTAGREIMLAAHHSDAICRLAAFQYASGLHAGDQLMYTVIALTPWRFSKYNDSIMWADFGAV